MKPKPTVLRWFLVRLHIIFPLFVFALLLARNPFSVRTLIPNLEPYPDSIHYISPALNFLQGQGLYIAREGRKLLPSVPPLYSFALMPIFVLNHDVRMFYFVNVALSLASFFLFFLIVRKIVSSRLYQFVLLMIFVTNFVMYWFPELAMAENLILPLSLLAIYLLIIPITRKTALAAGAVSVAFYATKFASLPLSVAVPFLFLIKIVIAKKKNREKGSVSRFILSFLIFGFIYNLYEYLFRGSNLLLGLFGLFWSLFSPKTIVETAKGGGGGGGFFSLQYASSNIRSYVQWLLGNSLTVLWKTVTILPKFLIIPAWIGFFASFFSSKRWISFVLLSLLVSNIFFMMTFYAADGRYFIIAIPIVILNIGLLFSSLEEKLQGRVKAGSILLVLALCGVYFITSLSRLKFDMMLNLKYAETPWYYISIRTFDNYLTLHSKEFSKEPVVISALPPYLVDFYAKEKFILLPLDPNQEFRSHAKEAWGEYDYAHLLDVYTQLLKDGHPVFLTQYGLGNEQYLHIAFDTVKASFETKEVVNGCYNLCSVYRLELKSETKKK